MSKIEKIRAEIERRHAYQKEMYSKTKPDGRPNDGWAESLAIMGELEELRNFLDTLEEEPEVDLEKETKRWWEEHLHLNPKNQLWMDAHQSVVFARHFYELGKNSLK